MGESEEAEVTSGGPPVVVAEVSLMGWSRETGAGRSLRHLRLLLVREHGDVKSEIERIQS